MKEITSWNIKKSNLLVDKLFDIWTYKNYISKKWKNNTTMILSLSTAGWSGNEEIIDALEKNQFFWLMFWTKSERGGRYTFEIDFSIIGFKTVSEFTKEMGFSRQYVNQNKEKFEWIIVSEKKRLVRTKIK